MIPRAIAVLETRFAELDRRNDERHRDMKEAVAASRLESQGEHAAAMMAIGEVKEQALKTNSKVTELQKWRANIEGAKGAVGAWRSGVLLLVAGGTGAVITALISHVRG